MWLTLPILLIGCGGPHTPHVNPTAQAKFLAAQNLRPPATNASESQSEPDNVKVNKENSPPMKFTGANTNQEPPPIPTETKLPPLPSAETLPVRLLNGKKASISYDGNEFHLPQTRRGLIAKENPPSPIEKAVIYSSCREVGLSEDRSSDLCAVPLKKLENLSSADSFNPPDWKGVSIQFRIGENEELKTIPAEIKLALHERGGPHLEIWRDKKRAGLFKLGNGDIHTDALYPKQTCEIFRGSSDGKPILVVKIAAPEGESWIVALPASLSPNS